MIPEPIQEILVRYSLLTAFVLAGALTWAGHLLAGIPVV